MSEQDNNPQLEEETKNEEELEDESTEEESEESNDESEDSEDESNEELERLRQENAKYKRLLAKKAKKPTKDKEGADDDELRQDVESLKTSERKRQFGYENELSPDEVDKVFQIDPNPSSKTLKDPFVKAGLEALRRQRRVNENTPSSSAKASPVSGKDFKKLSSAEKDKVWQKHLESKSQS